MSSPTLKAALVEAVQKAGGDCQGVVINAAAYTHTSVALLDAVLCCPVPVVEVHISNPQARDEFPPCVIPGQGRGRLHRGLRLDVIRPGLALVP